jgi:hypothetical protein
MKSFTFSVRFVRRIPDPVFPECERHILLCALSDLPEGLPTDPNPRKPRIDRLIWRDIKKHLLNEDGTPNTFHLKNKGITLIAQRVNKFGDQKIEKIELQFEQGQGIVDGGHTYELVMQNRSEIEDRNSNGNDDFSKISQFIKLEVLTGIAPDLSHEIAGGLNTAVQVQEMSLMELENEFDWIKDELRNERYADQIAYREGEPAPYDARDIIVLLDLFNVFDFRNDRSEHPVRAYTSKAQVLANYKAKQAQYKKLRPILKDILILHDTIAIEARDKHNDGGGRGGNLAFVEDRKRGEFEFLFNGKESKYRLGGGALFPMLAAFRWMVEINPTTELAEWRGGFSAVQALWNETGTELMRATQETSAELGRKPYAIGRSRNHWATLHKTVANADLVHRTAA